MTTRISRAAWRTSELGYNRPGYKHTELRSLFYDRNILMVQAALLTSCPDVDAVKLIMESINIENALQKEIINARLNLRPFTIDERRLCRPSYAAAILDFHKIWTEYLDMDYSNQDETPTLLSQIYTGRYNNYEEVNDIVPPEKVHDSVGYLEGNGGLTRLSILEAFCKLCRREQIQGLYTYEDHTYGRLFRNIRRYYDIYGNLITQSDERSSELMRVFYMRRPDTYIDDAPDDPNSTDIGPVYGPEEKIKIISVKERKRLEAKRKDIEAEKEAENQAIKNIRELFA